MESTPEQTAEGLALCQVLANVLERLVQANCHLARTDPGQVTRFHAMKAPGIAVQQYLERIHKYASCSNECFVLALIYIDRLIQRSNFLLTELNVHRVVITAVLLAAKFFDDAYYNNAYYAKVGGVLVSEMNGLEVDFLFRINFSLHVAPDVFAKYRSELMVHSSVVNNNGNSMQPILETLVATQVYSPQTVPMQTQSDVRIHHQHHGGHQVTPSPPTPPDYAALVNPYEVVFHPHHHAVATQHQQQLGFHPILEHQPPYSVDPLNSHHHHHHLHTMVANTTASYFPQHFADNPYYVPPPNAGAVPQQHHYDTTSQDCSAVASSGGGGGWNYAMLGVSGAGI